MKNSNEECAVIITGAGGGIGTALCRHFKDAGYFVVGTVRTRPKDMSAYNEIIQLDLNELATDPNRSKTFENSVRKAINKRPIKALINNAAIQILAPSSELTAAQMTLSYNVNTLAPFLLSKIVLEDLTRNHGSILNIGTVHAQATKPEFVAYTTSKTAMHALTRAMAVDLGGRVRVNTLAPGATLTPMLKAGFEGKDDAFSALESCHPAQRIASVDEIAEVALFLCSDKASFITGTTLNVDGGILARLHDPA